MTASLGTLQSMLSSIRAQISGLGSSDSLSSGGDPDVPHNEKTSLIETTIAKASHHQRQNTEQSFLTTIVESIQDSTSVIRRTIKRKRINWFVIGMFVGVLFYSLLITLGPLHLSLRPRSIWCPYAAAHGDQAVMLKVDQVALRNDDEESPYDNPDYSTDPCRYLRLPQLLGLTLEDCDISRRMLVANLLGGIIGYERRSADRPAGIRTMGLVSLGACFFTISSIMAFKSSTMGWDASRVTAALPSGVGFLGGALIWKGTVFVNDQHREKQQVHGLTTAASLWLSAAIGVGAGGALYAVTVYATGLVLLMLRYGPKLYTPECEDEDEDGTADEPPAAVNEQHSLQRDDSTLFEPYSEPSILRDPDTPRTRPQVVTFAQPRPLTPPRFTPLDVAGPGDRSTTTEQPRRRRLSGKDIPTFSS